MYFLERCPFCGLCSYDLTIAPFDTGTQVALSEREQSHGHVWCPDMPEIKCSVEDLCHVFPTQGISQTNTERPFRKEYSNCALKPKNRNVHTGRFEALKESRFCICPACQLIINLEPCHGVVFLLVWHLAYRISRKIILYMKLILKSYLLLSWLLSPLPCGSLMAW